MRRLIFVGVGAVIIMAAVSGMLKAEDLTWEDIGRGNLNADCILAAPAGSGVIFAGSSGAILKSNDSGKSWRRVLGLSSKSRRVNQFLFDPVNRNIVYAATDNGLYRSNNLGGSWNRVFKGRSNDERQCLCLAVLPYAVFLGTRTGLFVSEDNARSWHKQNGVIGSAPILSIDFSRRKNNYIYLASLEGVFSSSDSGKSWEKIFAGHTTEKEGGESVDSEDHDEEQLYSDIRFLKADPFNPGSLYLATSKGIYINNGRGQGWDKLTEYGLLSRDVLMICISEGSRVFALTSSGIFVYEEQRWKELSFGLDAGRVNYIALDDKGTLYAAGEKGMFKSVLQVSAALPEKRGLREYFRDEPKINDLQRAAIRYAEVDPEKISRWRKKAAVKAILPQMRIGADRNSTDLWHWEGGSTTNCYDDILRRGRDSIDWDVSLTWDLSDLIWNEAQTSIDVRSRLMVELRDDILDQVNKLYFERLRVKMELDTLAIEDRKKRFEKELKLQELTASLDALTAGYYSEQLRQLSEIPGHNT